MSTDLSRCRLYGILDFGYVQRGHAAAVAQQLIDGGIDILQLRAKKGDVTELIELGTELHALTSAAGIPFIVNDHAAVAAAIGAEGVHVGQDDMTVAEARALAGNETIVGKSTHSVEQARRAAEEGADYIGFGPLFATPTKPDYTPIGLSDIRTVHALVAIPIFCIGGVKLDNIAAVLAAGAQRVVIVSGLLQANDVTAATRRAKELLA